MSRESSPSREDHSGDGDGPISSTPPLQRPDPGGPPPAPVPAAAPLYKSARRPTRIDVDPSWSHPGLERGKSNGKEWWQFSRTIYDRRVMAVIKDEYLHLVREYPGKSSRSTRGSTSGIHVQTDRFDSFQEAAIAGDKLLIEIFGAELARRMPLAVDRWPRIHRDAEVQRALKGTKPALRALRTRGSSSYEIHLVGFEYGHDAATIQAYVDDGNVPFSRDYLEDLPGEKIERKSAHSGAVKRKRGGPAGKVSLEELEGEGPAERAGGPPHVLGAAGRPGGGEGLPTQAISSPPPSTEAREGSPVPTPLAGGGGGGRNRGVGGLGAPHGTGRKGGRGSATKTKGRGRGWSRRSRGVSGSGSLSSSESEEPLDSSEDEYRPSGVRRSGASRRRGGGGGGGVGVGVGGRSTGGGGRGRGRGRGGRPGDPVDPSMRTPGQIDLERMLGLEKTGGAPFPSGDAEDVDAAAGPFPEPVTHEVKVTLTTDLALGRAPAQFVRGVGGAWPTGANPFNTPQVVPAAPPLGPRELPPPATGTPWMAAGEADAPRSHATRARRKVAGGSAAKLTPPKQDNFVDWEQIGLDSEGRSDDDSEIERVRPLPGARAGGSAKAAKDVDDPSFRYTGRPLGLGKGRPRKRVAVSAPEPFPLALGLDQGPLGPAPHVAAVAAAAAASSPRRQDDGYDTLEDDSDAALSTDFEAIFGELERSARAIPSEGRGRWSRRVKPSDILTPFAEHYAAEGRQPSILPPTDEDGSFLKLPPWPLKFQETLLARAPALVVDEVIVTPQPPQVEEIPRGRGRRRNRSAAPPPDDSGRPLGLSESSPSPGPGPGLARRTPPHRKALALPHGTGSGGGNNLSLLAAAADALDTLLDEREANGGPPAKRARTEFAPIGGLPAAAVVLPPVDPAKKGALVAFIAQRTVAVQLLGEWIVSALAEELARLGLAPLADPGLGRDAKALLLEAMEVGLVERLTALHPTNAGLGVTPHWPSVVATLKKELALH